MFDTICNYYNPLIINNLRQQIALRKAIGNYDLQLFNLSIALINLKRESCLAKLQYLQYLQYYQ
jgi:hypothetical protein